MRRGAPAALLLVGALAVPPAAALEEVRSVEGPLPTTAESHPFGGAAHTLVPFDLEAAGYVEEEYLVSGKADVYDWSDVGAAIPRSTPVTYVTRVLVRRPERRERFSGNAVVELLNPSNLFDLNIGWALMAGEMIEHGDAWVGITAKPVSAATLRTFDPTRYGRVAWPNPLPLEDPRNCGQVAADSARDTENGLVWDIYTAVAGLLRSARADNPLGYGALDPSRVPVERLYAFGYSQTGAFLYTYIAAIHPLALAGAGRPPFDGYLVAAAGGPSPINQCAERLEPGDPRRQLHDVGVPIVRVVTQSDVLRTLEARRWDNDRYADRFRSYEIAGAGHATPDELRTAAAPADIRRGGREVPPMACNEGPRSRFPNQLAFDAALRNLDLWVRDGTPPPRAEPILVEDGGMLVDGVGNVRGGLRSPLVDVPTSVWHGNSTGPSFCRIAGHETPLGRERLRVLYPDHDAYVHAVRVSVEGLVAQRFLTLRDGERLIAEATAADVP